MKAMITKLKRWLFGTTEGDTLQAVMLAFPETGKSSLAKGLAEAAADPTAPRVADGLRFDPHPALLGRKPPKTVGQPVRITGRVKCGGRTHELVLLDPPGELTELTAADADDAIYQGFLEAMETSGLAVVAFSPKDLCDRPADEFDDLLRKLTALLVRAVRHRAALGLPTSVAVVFTKADEYGAAEVGSVRVAGDNPAVLATMRRLQAANPADAPARLGEFLGAASADGSNEWSAVRGRLLRRTAVLWENLLRCECLPPREVNGYFVQADPADAGTPTPWGQRGLLHLFHDHFAGVAKRNRPGRPHWLAVGAAAVAVLAVGGFAANATRRAAAADERLAAYTDGPNRVPPLTVARKPADGDKWFIGTDDGAEMEVLLELHRRIRRAADGLKRADGWAAAKAARAAGIDHAAVWAALTPREQAWVLASPRLVKTLDAFRDLEDLCRRFEAEASMLSDEMNAEFAALKKQADTPGKLSRLRGVEERRAKLVALAGEFRAHPLGRGGFVEPTPEGDRVRPFADALFAPLATRAETLAADARTRCGTELDAVKANDPVGYLAWQLARGTAEVQFILGIRIDEPVNPLAYNFPHPTESRPHRLFGVPRLPVVLRIEDRTSRRLFDLDFASGTATERLPDGATADTEEFGTKGGPLKVTDAVRYDVRGVFVAPALPPCEVGYRPLALACRGETDHFHLPAFLDAVKKGAVALEGNPTGDIGRVWKQWAEKLDPPPVTPVVVPAPAPSGEPDALPDANPFNPMGGTDPGPPAFEVVPNLFKTVRPKGTPRRDLRPEGDK